MNRRDEGNRDDGRAAAAATVADMFRAVYVGEKVNSPLSLGDARFVIGGNSNKR